VENTLAKKMKVVVMGNEGIKDGKKLLETL